MGSSIDDFLKEEWYFRSGADTGGQGGRRVAMVGRRVLIELV